MVNLLIANKDTAFIKALINTISDDQLRVLKVATNKNETIKFFTTTNIDIAIVDFEIYKYIEVELKKNKYRFAKSIIITSTNTNEELENDSLIYCSILQNSDLSFIHKKVKELVLNKFKDTNIANIKKKIKNEMNYLNYNPIYVGTNYIIESILLIAQSEEDLISNLEKDVYPIIAEKYNKTISNIKCNIHQSTTNMYYECDSNKLQCYFNLESDVKPKPKLVMTTILNKILYN